MAVTASLALLMAGLLGVAAPAWPVDGGDERPSGSTPAVDLAALERQLRETDAIGLFTKLALKGDIDDLLDRFRQFHRGRGDSALSELHERFNLLVMKVLSLLQDDDPSLAREIATSREALWHRLADPGSFAPAERRRT
jgi:hypothetical protein